MLVRRNLKQINRFYLTLMPFPVISSRFTHTLINKNLLSCHFRSFQIVSHVVSGITRHPWRGLLNNDKPNFRLIWLFNAKLHLAPICCLSSYYSNGLNNGRTYPRQVKFLFGLKLSFNVKSRSRSRSNSHGSFFISMTSRLSRT